MQNPSNQIRQKSLTLDGMKTEPGGLSPKETQRQACEGDAVDFIRGGSCQSAPLDMTSIFLVRH